MEECGGGHQGLWVSPQILHLIRCHFSGDTPHAVSVYTTAVTNYNNALHYNSNTTIISLKMHCCVIFTGSFLGISVKSSRSVVAPLIIQPTCRAGWS